MKRIRVFSVIMTFIIASLCVSFFGVEKVNAAVKISQTKITMSIGQKKTLKLNGAKGKITWKSSDKRIAEISSKGVVKAKKSGQATITAKASNGKKTCKVTVRGEAILSGTGFSQDGMSFTNSIFDALDKNSAIELDYESETGLIWLVFPYAEAGWIRVGAGDAIGENQKNTVYKNGKAYIPYSYIEAELGTDRSTWGDKIQIESDSNWKVYSISVCKWK